MSEHWKGMIVGRAIVAFAALVLGCLLAVNSTASAQTDDCGSPAPKGWVVDNPPAETRQEIQDLLFRYAWTIDEWQADQFAGLFAQAGSSYYQICNTSGPVLKLTLELGEESADDLLTQMGIILKDLESKNLHTRHLVTNTLFDVIDEKTIKTKSIVLVTLQDSDSSEPVVDYSADARATFTKVTNDSPWRFQSLTIHADTPATVARKR